MARGGNFGRVPRAAPSLTNLLVSIAREMQSARDKNIMDAWKGGGLFEGKEVTDEMVLDHWKKRMDGVSPDDPAPLGYLLGHILLAAHRLGAQSVSARLPLDPALYPTYQEHTLGYIPTLYQAAESSNLVDHNEGMIVLPGSVGTFSELTLAWSFMQVGEISQRPFVLIGDLWRQTIHTFANSDYLRPQDFDLLTFVDTPAEAVAYIQKSI